LLLLCRVFLVFFRSPPPVPRFTTPNIDVWFVWEMHRRKTAFLWRFSGCRGCVALRRKGGPGLRCAALRCVSCHAKAPTRRQHFLKMDPPSLPGAVNERLARLRPPPLCALNEAPPAPPSPASPPPIFCVLLQISVSAAISAQLRRLALQQWSMFCPSCATCTSGIAASSKTSRPSRC